jgi:hypothetical protein
MSVIRSKDSAVAPFSLPYFCSLCVSFGKTEVISFLSSAFKVLLLSVLLLGMPEASLSLKGADP